MVINKNGAMMKEWTEKTKEIQRKTSTPTYVFMT
jgi:hypothetical protein